MVDNNEYRQFLPDDEFDRDLIIVDVPIAPASPELNQIPNGYDPMGRVYLGGRANRRLASGRTPWWVLISSWFIAGITIFAGLIPLFPLSVIELLIVIIVLPFPLAVLWRGTKAKLSSNKTREND
jgi:hypothetical protein